MATRKTALKSATAAAAAQIYAVLTNRGAELEAAALATGVPVKLSKFAIGDANGQEEVTPDPARTALIHEVYRGDIHGAETKGNQVTFTLDVPPETGGYTIREVGILTDAGELYSVARSPDILKPTESNGAVISITYKYTLAVSSTSTVTVIVYNDYLTPDAADARYLQISQNLKEIANKGTSSQLAARENIGINGDIAYRDKANTFLSDNAFNRNISFKGDGCYLSWPTSDTNACGLMYGSGLAGGALLSFLTTDELMLASTYRFSLKVPDANKAYVRVVDNYYTIWNSGNLTPVRKVNNVSPDANGNVTISVSSAGVQDIRLGAETTITKEGDHDQLYECPAGCVVTAVYVVDGGGREAAVETISYKSIQKLISNQWVIISG